jgi:hypothetical protein
MNIRRMGLCLLALILFGQPAPLMAQEQTEKPAEAKAGEAKSSEAKAAEPKEESSVTEHTLSVRKQTIPYKRRLRPRS